MAERPRPWANLRLEFTVDGCDDKHVVVYPIQRGEDILDGVEQVGRILVNTFAKEAADRLAFRKANASMNESIVDKTVDMLKEARKATYQHPQRARNGA